MKLINVDVTNLTMWILVHQHKENQSRIVNRTVISVTNLTTFTILRIGFINWVTMRLDLIPYFKMN